jgi:hypothetical protein
VKRINELVTALTVTRKRVSDFGKLLSFHPEKVDSNRGSCLTGGPLLVQILFWAGKKACALNFEFINVTIEAFHS